jgi:hypothetical protein
MTAAIPGEEIDVKEGRVQTAAMVSASNPLKA